MNIIYENFEKKIRFLYNLFFFFRTSQQGRVLTSDEILTIIDYCKNIKLERKRNLKK